MSALPCHVSADGQDRLLPLPKAAELLAPITRWTALRKEQLLRAIALGMVTEAQVCGAHQIDADEITMWRSELARTGISGLRICQGVRYGRRAAHKQTARFCEEQPRAAIHRDLHPTTAA